MLLFHKNDYDSKDIHFDIEIDFQRGHDEFT